MNLLITRAFAHKALLAPLFSALGSVASLLGLLCTLKPKRDAWGTWQTLLALTALIFFVILCLVEFNSRARKHVYLLSDKKGIRDYMFHWLSTGERVAIWSRDLSWVTDDEMRQLLESKARNSDLIICLPTATDLTRHLQTIGAEIRAYAGSSMNPGSRFTVVHLGKDGARVAVGRPEGDYHVIEEFAAGEHPAFYMAVDLVELARFKSATT